MLRQANGLGLRDHGFLLRPLCCTVSKPLDLAFGAKLSTTVTRTGITPAMMSNTMPAVCLTLDLLGRFLIVLAQTGLEPKLNVDVLGVDLLQEARHVRYRL